MSENNNYQFSLIAAAAPQVKAVSAEYTGGGNSNVAIYYWVVARYPGGVSVPTGPIEVTGTVGEQNLSSSKFVTVSWTSMPSATGYDVIRSQFPRYPANPTCSMCARVLNTSATTYVDQGASGNPYPATGLVSSVQASGVMTIDNLTQSVPVVKFQLGNSGYNLGLVDPTVPVGDFVKVGAGGVLVDGGTGGGGVITTASLPLLITGSNIAISTLTTFGTANQLMGSNAGATAIEYKTLSVGTSGTDFAIANSAGGITFNLPTASAVNRGALSSADWTTFNSKAGFPGAGIANSTGSAWGTSYSVTGTGTVVALATSPVLVTPTLGVATATSINGLTLTSSTGVVTITNGKTLAVTNSLTLSGTDSTTMTFPSTSQSIPGLGITNTFTATQIIPAIKPTSDSTTALQLQNAAGTAVVTVDTTNKFVGIGTTPAFQLDLSGGPDNQGIRLKAGVGTSLFRLTASDTPGNTVDYFQTATGSGFAGFYANGSANNLQLGANSSARIVIKASNGSVGIGPSNTSPTGTLHVFDATASTGTTRTVIKAGAGDISTDPLLSIQNNAGTSNFSVTRDGGVTLAGIARFNGTNTTGAGAAVLGANSPAVTLTAPYTWIQVTTSDGSTAYIPVWK